MSGKSFDIGRPIKLTYIASYTDAEGTDVTDKQISSAEYSKYSDLTSKAPFKLDVEAADANIGDAVTIKVVVTYYEIGAEVATTAESSFDTVFK